MDLNRKHTILQRFPRTWAIFGGIIAMAFFLVGMVISPAPIINLDMNNIDTPRTAAPTDFISIWNTSAISDGSSEAYQISLPLESSGNYNFIVEWDETDNDTIIEWNQTEVTHTYLTEGVKTINISGICEGWRFNSGGDKLKLQEISQWGTVNLGNSGVYFYGCENFNLTATDALNLTGTTNLYQAFGRCSNLGASGSMNIWDVSAVTNMGYMLYYAD